MGGFRDLLKQMAGGGSGGGLPPQQASQAGQRFSRAVEANPTAAYQAMLQSGVQDISLVMQFAIEGHLYLMYHFLNMLDNIESLASTGEMKDKSPTWVLEEFLVYAEHRYKLWLDAMASCPDPIQRTDFCPPWDIMIMYYVHHLSPLRFQADMEPYYRVWGERGTFTILPDGGFQAGGVQDRFFLHDPQPTVWNTYLPSEPFNPWNLTMTDDFSSAQFDPFKNVPSANTNQEQKVVLPTVICPRCRASLAHLSFQEVRATHPACKSCTSPLVPLLFPAVSLHLPSAVHRQRAFWARLLAGSIPAFRPGAQSPPSAPNPFNPGGYANNPAIVAPHLAALAAARGSGASQLARLGILANAAGATMFTNPNSVPPLATTVDGLADRLLRFLALVTARDPQTGQYAPMVPTLDIELVWETFLLSHKTYMQFCAQHLGRAIDHADLDPSAAVGEGMAQTERAWWQWFGGMYRGGPDAGWVDLGGLRAVPETVDWTNIRLFRVSEQVQEGWVQGTRVAGLDSTRPVVTEMRDAVAANYWLRYPRESWYSQHALTMRREYQPSEPEAAEIIAVRQRNGGDSLSRRMMLPMMMAAQQRWQQARWERRRGRTSDCGGGDVGGGGDCGGGGCGGD